MRSPVLRPWIGLACAALLLGGCGGEQERGPTVQQQEFAEELAPEEEMAEEGEAPAPEPVPAAEPEEAAGSDAAEAQARALAEAGRPPQGTKPLERVPGQPDSEVPWLPDGELIEVERLGDPEEPGQDMSRTVFEVKATPEATLASYEQVLVKGGWKTEYMDPETLLGYQGNTMIMASVIRGSGSTRLEVFVTPKPEGIEDAGNL
jgi:hypothetical protein